MTDISIIIPAHNEEDFLPKCLESISQARELIPQASIELILVANRCGDQTEEIAEVAGCLVIQNSDKNLSKIRNAGIQAASGDIIITIDADSQMSKNMLKNIQDCMTSGKYIGGGVLILPDRWSLGIAFTILGLLPFLFFMKISAGAFFGWRDDILAIGGFNEERYSAEDIDFARRLKAHGKTKDKKFKNLLGSHIITSTRKFDRFGDWYAFQHPILMLKLLKGRKSKEADEIWYDFNN